MNITSLEKYIYFSNKRLYENSPFTGGNMGFWIRFRRLLSEELDCNRPLGQFMSLIKIPAFLIGLLITILVALGSLFSLFNLIFGI